jgi:hypothetical protein
MTTMVERQYTRYATVDETARGVLRLIFLATMLPTLHRHPQPEEPPMPRALTRDEQAILALVRRSDAALPVPELAVRLNLAVPVAQAACDYW